MKFQYKLQNCNKLKGFNLIFREKCKLIPLKLLIENVL